MCDLILLNKSQEKSTGGYQKGDSPDSELTVASAI